MRYLKYVLWKEKLYVWEFTWKKTLSLNKIWWDASQSYSFYCAVFVVLWDDRLVSPQWKLQCHCSPIGGRIWTKKKRDQKCKRDLRYIQILLTQSLSSMSSHSLVFDLFPQTVAESALWGVNRTYHSGALWTGHVPLNDLSELTKWVIRYSANDSIQLQLKTL